MKPIIFTFPTTNVQAVAKTQNVAGAGPVVLNGISVSNYLPTPGNLIAGSGSAFSWANTRAAQFSGFSTVVSIASTINLTAVNFTITGYLDGFPVSETRAGPLGVGGPNPVIVYTTQMFSIVTSVTADGAANSVSIGTGNSGKTNWFGHDYYLDVADTAVQVDTTTATYSFITTLDNVQTKPYSSLLTFTPIAAMTGATTDQLASYETPGNYSAILITALTGGPVAGVPTGSVVATFMQQGIYG